MSTLLCSYLPNELSSGSFCNVATKSRKNVHIFGLLQSIAPRPGPRLWRAGNVWSARIKEEARNAKQEMGVHQADQSQCLWSTSLRHVVTFLRRCTSSYGIGYGVGLAPTQRRHRRYSVDSTQKHKSGFKLLALSWDKEWTALGHTLTGSHKHG